MSKNIQGAIYAGDLALWCSEEYITTANYSLQEAWAWLVKVYEKKTTFTIFSLSNQQQRVHLKPNGQTQHQEDTPTYLSHPGSKTYLEKPATEEPGQSKDEARLDEETVMHRDGADQNVLKKLYISSPVLEYGIAANSTAAKSNSSMLS